MASALIAQIAFLEKSALKILCTNFFFREKLLQIAIRNFWSQLFFDRATGVASALIAQFGILVKSAFKMHCTKIFPDKSCYKPKATTFMLCNIFRYLTPFWSYSGLRNTSRKFCAVLRNRFFFMFVDAIPLERLNQSEPNFHT